METHQRSSTLEVSLVESAKLQSDAHPDFLMTTLNLTMMKTMPMRIIIIIIIIITRQPTPPPPPGRMPGTQTSPPVTQSVRPLATEALGSLNSSAVFFVSELGRRLSESTGDPPETAFLFQRLTVSV